MYDINKDFPVKKTSENSYRAAMLAVAALGAIAITQCDEAEADMASSHTLQNADLILQIEDDQAREMAMELLSKNTDSARLAACMILGAQQRTKTFGILGVKDTNYAVAKKGTPERKNQSIKDRHVSAAFYPNGLKAVEASDVWMQSRTFEKGAYFAPETATISGAMVRSMFDQNGQDVLYVDMNADDELDYIEARHGHVTPLDPGKAQEAFRETTRQRLAKCMGRINPSR